MDRSITDWQDRMRGLDADELRNSWEIRSKVDRSWQEETNYHFAVAERMKQLGNMAIDLDDKTRVKLCRQAEEIVEKLQQHMVSKPQKIAEMEKISKESDAYHKAFGTKTARYYMYEQGIIDLLGDRLKPVG